MRDPKVVKQEIILAKRAVTDSIKKAQAQKERKGLNFEREDLVHTAPYAAQEGQDKTGNGEVTSGLDGLEVGVMPQDPAATERYAGP